MGTTIMMQSKTTSIDNTYDKCDLSNGDQETSCQQPTQYVLVLQQKASLESQFFMPLQNDQQIVLHQRKISNMTTQNNSSIFIETVLGKKKQEKYQIQGILKKISFDKISLDKNPKNSKKVRFEEVVHKDYNFKMDVICNSISFQEKNIIKNKITLRQILKKQIQSTPISIQDI